MNIFSNCVVTMNFRLFDVDGELIEKNETPVMYLHGGYSGIFPKVEDALNGKTTGDQIRISLEPNEGFGDYAPELIRLVDVKKLPPDVQVGGYLTVGEGISPMVVPYSTAIMSWPDKSSGLNVLCSMFARRLKKK